MVNMPRAPLKVLPYAIPNMRVIVTLLYRLSRSARAEQLRHRLSLQQGSIQLGKDNVNRRSFVRWIEALGFDTYCEWE